MVNIFSDEVAYVYGFRNLETKKINIGLKTSNGESKYTYITSIKSKEFWDDYSKGLMEQTILYVGPIDSARTAEWFALEYGTNTYPEKFYNFKNNAHCVDEKLITANDRRVIVDYIEGRGNGIEVGGDDTQDANFNRNIIESIASRIESDQIKSFTIPTIEVQKYKRIQVRAEIVNHSDVSKIRTRLLEDPKLARKTFKPIAVVIMKNGERCVVNGNTRLAAALKTPGWDEVPVVFIHESEFGSTKSQRIDNYQIFGLYMNKEDFELRVTNSKEDLKRNINNYLARRNLDLNKPMHVSRARQLIYNNFCYVCGSKQQLNGILSSILNDFAKNQAVLKYQHNLLTYDEAFFQRYCWEKYNSKDIATVHVSVSEAAHGKAIGYILRRMKNTASQKGAIVFHYTSKPEIANEERDNWIKDTQDTISFLKLPIVIDVLPHHPDEALDG
jgi:hypothetical protein